MPYCCTPLANHVWPAWSGNELIPSPSLYKGYPAGRSGLVASHQVDLLSRMWEQHSLMIGIKSYCGQPSAYLSLPSCGQGRLCVYHWRLIPPTCYHWGMSQWTLAHLHHSWLCCCTEARPIHLVLGWLYIWVQWRTHCAQLWQCTQLQPSWAFVLLHHALFLSLLMNQHFLGCGSSQGRWLRIQWLQLLNRSSYDNGKSGLRDLFIKTLGRWRSSIFES